MKIYLCISVRQLPFSSFLAFIRHFYFQVAQIRFKLADIYENEGDAREATKMLMAVPLETGQRWFIFSDLYFLTFFSSSAREFCFILFIVSG